MRHIVTGVFCASLLLAIMAVSGCGGKEDETAKLEGFRLVMDTRSVLPLSETDYYAQLPSSEFFRTYFPLMEERGWEPNLEEAEFVRYPKQGGASAVIVPLIDPENRLGGGVYIELLDPSLQPGFGFVVTMPGDRTIRYIAPNGVESTAFFNPDLGFASLDIISAGPGFDDWDEFLEWADEIWGELPGWAKFVCSVACGACLFGGGGPIAWSACAHCLAAWGLSHIYLDAARKPILSRNLSQPVYLVPTMGKPSGTPGRAAGVDQQASGHLMRIAPLIRPPGRYLTHIAAGFINPLDLGGPGGMLIPMFLQFQRRAGLQMPRWVPNFRTPFPLPPRLPA